MFAEVPFPQELIYLTGLLVFCALSLIFATAIAARISCGFGCTETLYTEIFMCIEHRSLGDRRARLRLGTAGCSTHKLGHRGGKHLA